MSLICLGNQAVAAPACDLAMDCVDVALAGGRDDADKASCPQDIPPTKCRT